MPNGRRDGPGLPFVRGTVLVVEDSPSDRWFLKETLSKHLAGSMQLELIFAESLEDADLEIASRTPDLILLDLGFPRLGDEDLAGIGVLDKWQPSRIGDVNVPIIVVTRHAKDGVAPMIGNLCYWIVEKPCFDDRRDVQRFQDLLHLAIRSALAIKGTAPKRRSFLEPGKKTQTGEREGDVHLTLRVGTLELSVGRALLLLLLLVAAIVSAVSYGSYAGWFGR